MHMDSIIISFIPAKIKYWICGRGGGAYPQPCKGYFIGHRAWMQFILNFYDKVRQILIFGDEGRVVLSLFGVIHMRQGGDLWVIVKTPGET